MNDDLHSLAPAYVLDALDRDERQRFEEHLGGCASCRDDVATLRDGADALADAARIEPSRELRARVLADVGATPQDRPAGSVSDLDEHRHRRAARSALLAAAAALILVVGGVLVFGDDRRSDVDDVLAQADSIETELAATEATGSVTVVWSPGTRRAAFIGTDLPEPAEGTAYELWAIIDGTPRPTSLLDRSGGDVRAVTTVDEGDPAAWGVTIEPTGGSAAPTTPILHFGEI